MAGNLASMLVPALVFGAVVLAVLALRPLFRRKVDLKARVTFARSGRAYEVGEETARVISLRTNHTGSLWARLVAEVEARGLSLDDDKAGVLAEKLALAGYDTDYAVRVYGLVRATLTLLLPMLVYVVVMVVGAEVSPLKLYLLLTSAAAAGLYLPGFVVNRRADARRTEVLNGFPDALDLMLVCVQAGLGIDACFARVGQEIIELHPRLSALFASVSLELRAGRGRADALKSMAKRSGVEEIRAFATLITQSDKLGASIGQALKVYAEEMREARRMRAEEKAHRLPVLLSVPLVVFLLPTMIGVLALPAYISLKGALGGG